MYTPSWSGRITMGAVVTRSTPSRHSSGRSRLSFSRSGIVMSRFRCQVYTKAPSSKIVTLSMGSHSLKISSPGATLRRSACATSCWNCHLVKPNASNPFAYRACSSLPSSTARSSERCWYKL